MFDLPESASSITKISGLTVTLIENPNLARIPLEYFLLVDR